tara:strand:- start:226 stop:1146 length:921 start_codon:yes stop_codon:yes gene_type:complete
MIETQTERVSMQELAYQIREELKPVTKLFDSFEEDNEFLLVRSCYFPLTKIDFCLRARKLDYDYVTDHCLETETYRPKKRILIDISDDYLADDPKSLEDLAEDDFIDKTALWNGLLQVDFQLGETFSRGFLITTGEGLKYLKRRRPDIHRGLTQQADGTLDQGSFSIDEYKRETYEHPSKASWRNTKRDYVGGKRVDGEWVDGYWKDVKHTDIETDNFVWWFYEYSENGMELIPWEREAHQTIRCARSEEDKEKIASYLKSFDGRRKKKVLAHSVQEQKQRLSIERDLLNEVYQHIDLRCLLTRRY